MFKSLGAAIVLDLSLFSGLALELAYQEFNGRFSKGDKFKQVTVNAQQAKDVETTDETMEETKQTAVEESKQQSKG